MKFMNLKTKKFHGGILTDSGDVICGCCGGIFKASDENITWKPVEIYETWINLDEQICGDDIE